MQLFCISCPKIKKNNELIYIKWFFYRKITKKYEKIAKKQEKTDAAHNNRSQRDHREKHGFTSTKIAKKS